MRKLSRITVKTILITLIPFSLTACNGNTNAKESLGKDSIVYLHCNQHQKSTYVYNMVGSKVVVDRKLKDSHLDSLTSYKKDLFLYGNYTNKVVTINNNSLSKENTKELKNDVLFYAKQKDLEFSVINIDVHKNTITIKDNNKTFEENVPPLVTKGVADKKGVYLYSDEMMTGKGILYIWDRERKMMESIPLNTSLAQSLAIYKNQIIMTTRNKLTIYNLNTKKVSYKSFAATPLLKDVFVTKDGLYVTYNGRKNFGVLKLNDRFDVLEQQKYEMTYLASKYKKNKLYVISSKDDKDYGFKNNVMNVIDFKNKKVISKIKIPEKKYALCDFSVVNSSEK